MWRCANAAGQADPRRKDLYICAVERPYCGGTRVRMHGYTEPRTRPFAQYHTKHSDIGHATTRPPRAARSPPRTASGCMRPARGPEATDPPRGGRCGSCRRRCCASPTSTRVGRSAAMEARSCASPRRARSASVKGATLAAVLRVDGRKAPSARTRKRSVFSMCSHCTDCHGTRAVHVVSLDVHRDGQGPCTVEPWLRSERLRVPRMVKNEV